MRQPSKFAQSCPPGDSESGIVLLVVIFLTFLMLLSLAIAAPEWAHQMQRQKDIQTIRYGRQYERAIQLYYRKFHAYPTTVKQLLDTNDVRFLRQQYPDPLTGKDDWKLVLYGHAHVHPLGLFGKPLADLGTVQTSGGMYAMNSDSNSGASGPSAARTAGNDSMGFGSSSGSGFGSSFGSPINGSGSTSGNTGSIFNDSSSAGTSAASDSGFHTNMPFVGVVPPLKKKSIIDYRAQNNYSRWEFNYDPVVDMLRAKVSILGGSLSDLNGATNLDGSSEGSLNGSNGNSTNTSNSPFGSSNILGNSGSASGTGGSNNFLDSGSQQ